MFGRFAVCRQIAHKNSLASFRFSYPTLLLCYYARPMQSHATHKNVHKNIIIQRRFTTDPELKSNLYQVKVYTGDRRGAGTTARIFMTLYGEKGNSGARRLRGPNNKLERGSVVSFLVSSSHLGDLNKLVIGHDNSDIGADWFLEKIVVKSVATGREWVFLCNRWLDAVRDGGKTTRELKARLYQNGVALDDSETDELGGEVHEEGRLWRMNKATVNKHIESPNRTPNEHSLHNSSHRHPVEKKREKTTHDHHLHGWDLGLHAAVCCIPHPSKSETGGEDAFAVVMRNANKVLMSLPTPSEDPKMSISDDHLPSSIVVPPPVIAGNYKSPVTQRRKGQDVNHSVSTLETINRVIPDTLCVADGVGEWREKGVDAGLYSRQLVREIVRILQAHEGNQVDPKRVLDQASVELQKSDLLGSSTVTLLMFDHHNSVIHSANLGDSGFIVVRKGKIIFRSPQQEHYFGFPYQLSKEGNETASDAQIAEVNVHLGDIIIVASDGLFDNVEDEDIASIAWMYRHASSQAVAEHIATLAFQNSTDKHIVSPYSRAATEEYGIVYRGGKMDDITIIVAKIVRYRKKTS